MGTNGCRQDSKGSSDITNHWMEYADNEKENDDDLLRRKALKGTASHSAWIKNSSQD